MNTNPLDELLGQRSGTERRVYDALRAGGQMTDRQLRDELHSPGSGPRDALVKLVELGLVRHAGKAPTKNRPMLWEVTPVAEIENQRERYAVRKPVKRAKRGAASPQARLAELRRMEPGDPRKWFPNRDNILAALPLLTNTTRMSFWDSVPPDELRLAQDEIEELHAAAADALAAIQERLEHERLKDKIEKLGRKAGRTDAELQIAEQKADKLRGKLISPP